MMDGAHPGDDVLLAYVEDELDADERATVEAHLAGCEACAADVAGARAGREALRAAPLLELPATPRDRALAELSPRPAPGRSGTRRVLAVALPIAAALALIGGIVTVAEIGGNGSNGGGASEAGGGEASQESARDKGASTTGALQPSIRDKQALEAVAGSPASVAKELREQGFDARLYKQGVLVRTNRVAALRRVLEAKERGDVKVFVVP